VSGRFESQYLYQFLYQSVDWFHDFRHLPQRSARGSILRASSSSPAEIIYVLRGELVVNLEWF
jgi:hypothetical protein